MSLRDPYEAYERMCAAQNQAVDPRGLPLKGLGGHSGNAMGLGNTSGNSLQNQIGNATSIGNANANAYQREQLKYQMELQKLQMQAGMQYQPRREFAQLTKEDLQHDAFSTPLDVLANLWLAKYGDRWVPKGDVLDDEFFTLAAQRLLRLGKLEQYRIGGGDEVLRVLP